MELKCEQLAYAVASIGKPGGPENEAEAFKLAGYRDSVRTRKALARREVQELIAALRVPVSDQFLTFAPEALMTIVHLMRRAESEKVRRDCAKDILDYAGLRAPERKEVEHTVRVIEELRLEARRAIRDAQYVLEGREPSDGLPAVEDVGPIPERLRGFLKPAEVGGNGGD